MDLSAMVGSRPAISLAGRYDKISFAVICVRGMVLRITDSYGAASLIVLIASGSRVIVSLTCGRYLVNFTFPILPSDRCVFCNFGIFLRKDARTTNTNDEV